MRNYDDIPPLEPGDCIPNTYADDADVPFDHSEELATSAELAAAGFPGHAEADPGDPPADEVFVERHLEIPIDWLRAARFRVLRDGGGRIVATWDEGRWWTPEESAEFLWMLEDQLEERS